MSNGQLQSQLNCFNSGEQFDVSISHISCTTSLQKSLYVHDPIENPCHNVHLSGRARPATVLITSNVVWSRPFRRCSAVTLKSTVSVPGYLTGLNKKFDLELEFSQF